MTDLKVNVSLNNLKTLVSSKNDAKVSGRVCNENGQPIATFECSAYLLDSTVADIDANAPTKVHQISIEQVIST